MADKTAVYSKGVFMRKESICWLLLPMLLFTSLFTVSKVNAKESIIYGGGPFYDGAVRYRDMIRSSGFTTLMLWTIHIQDDGDLVYNNPKLIDNGVYVGKATWPAEVHAFKEGETSIRRIEFAIGAWGSGSFNAVRDLIAAEGTGPDSTLYKNFKLLKDTFPAVDGISYDDEVTYDVDSSVKFAVMLYDLGFKVTLCPYTRYYYWRDVYSQTNEQRPGAIDRIDLQCYAGGGGNNPGTWNNYFGGLHVTPGLWCYSTGDTPSQVQSKMTSWDNSYNIAGGFMWLFDDMLNHQNTYPVSDYAWAINNALGIDPTEQPVVTLFQHCPLDNGWFAELGVGAYTTADIVEAGGKDNDASSLRIPPGYQVTLFENDDFQGRSLVLREDIDCLNQVGWNDILSSLVVEPIQGPVGYWKFNDGSGLTATDEGEFGLDGTLNNMTDESWTTGKQCGALAFDGVDDYVEVQGFKGITGKSSRTCAAWLKTDANQTCMIASWGDDLIGEKWMFCLHANGSFAVAVLGGFIRSVDVVNDDKWHHIVAVLDNDGNPNVSEIELYLDGAKTETYSNNNVSINTKSTSMINIGTRFLQGEALQFYDGSIDEVQVYSRALSADEILDLYNQYAIVGDFVEDNIIDLKDFSVLAYDWQRDNVCDTDLTCDCTVDLDDMMVLVEQWLAN